MHGTNAPVGAWLFQVLGPLVWLALLVVAVVGYRRRGRLSLNSLIFLAGTTMWWQEWYADWGCYLLYNSQFRLIPWGSTHWTSPNKPWAIIPTYGWFMAVVFPAILGAAAVVRRRLPSVNRHLLLVVTAFVLFYLWDLFVEWAAIRMRWWDYVDHVGPALTGASGTFPLLHPIVLFTTFGVVMAVIMDQRDDKGRHRLEVLARTPTLRAGWPREAARLATWTIAMNGCYLLILVGPLIIIREKFGAASPLIP